MTPHTIKYAINVTSHLFIYECQCSRNIPYSSSNYYLFYCHWTATAVVAAAAASMATAAAGAAAAAAAAIVEAISLVNH